MSSNADSAYISASRTSNSSQSQRGGHSKPLSTPAPRRSDNPYSSATAAGESYRNSQKAFTPPHALPPLPVDNSPYSTPGQGSADIYMQSAPNPPLPPSMPGTYGSIVGANEIDLDDGQESSDGKMPQLTWAAATGGSELTPTLPTKFGELSLSDNGKTGLFGSFKNALSPAAMKAMRNNLGFAKQGPSSAQAVTSTVAGGSESSNTRGSSSSTSATSHSASAFMSGAASAVADQQHQVASSTDDTSSPESEEFQSATTGEAPDIHRLLHSQGEENIASPLHRYRICYVNLNAERPHKGLRKLLYEDVIRQLLPESFVQIDNMTYITTEEWTIPLGLGSAEDTGRHLARNVILSTVLVEDEAPAIADLRRTAYRSVTVGTQNNGRANRMRLRCHVTHLVQHTVSEQASISKDNVVHACGPPSGEGFTVGIWIEYQRIPMNDARKLMLIHNKASSEVRAELDCVVASSLREKLLAAGEGRNRITLHRNRAYSGMVKERLPCGLVLKAGLEGELVHSAGEPTRLVYRPCEHLFYDEQQTVADFIIAYLGALRTPEMDATVIAKLEKLMKGLKITVAVHNAFNNPDCIIQGLGGTALSNPESLNGIKGSITLNDLKFATMPLVDVGRSGRSFFFPAELCMIKPNQMFFGDVPKVDRPRLFEPKTIINDKQEQERRTFTFSVGSDDFKLLFVELVLPNEAASAKRLQPEIWRSFQHALGQRFEGKLAKAVTVSKKVTLECGSVESLLRDISKITAGLRGPKNVVIIALPRELARGTAKAIRLHCDRAIGVQCCFVRAAELQKRYHPTALKDLTKYTGQVVRKILGRANITETIVPQSDTSKTSDKNTNVGRLFGVYISNLQDSRPTDPIKNQSLYFVSIVSVSSGDDVDFCNTYHFLDLNNLQEPVANQLSRFLGEHARTIASPEMRCSAIYISSSMSLSIPDLDLLKNAMLEEVVRSIGNRARVGRGQDSTVILLQPQNQVNVDSTAGKRLYPLADCPDNKTSEFVSEFGLHDRALGGIYRRPDGFRNAGGALRIPTETYRVVYQRANLPYTAFERRHLPDILLVAKAALSRGRSYVVFDDSVESDQTCPYKMTSVHPALKGSLYFI